MCCSDSMFNKIAVAFKSGGILFYRDLKRFRREISIALLVAAALQLLFGKVCITRILVGLPCPFCGFTRAAILSAEFRFKEAFILQPMLFLFAGLLVLLVLKRYFCMHFLGRYIVIYLCLFVLSVFALYIYRLLFVFSRKAPVIYDGNNLLKIVINFIHFLQEGT